MNDDGRLGVQDEVESEKARDGNELMSECLTRKEVEQALDSLKRNQHQEVMEYELRWSATMYWWTLMQPLQLVLEVV